MVSRSCWTSQMLSHSSSETRHLSDDDHANHSDVRPASATADIPGTAGAKRELVRSVGEGMTAREARRRCFVSMHRTTVYRLLKHVEREGEQALAERRNGHPSILRGEVLTWMLNYCQNHVSASSSEVQRCLTERFGLSFSVSKLNRVCAAHGLSRQPVPPIPREKKPQAGVTIAPGYHEQASELLLLAAATETGLLTQLEQVLPPPPDSPCPPLAGSAAVRRRLLLTLLFLGVVGLHRTWDLRGYTAEGLALLTGRTRAYGYRYTEACLSQVACADGAERWTFVLVSWSTHLWHTPVDGTGGTAQPHALTCYAQATWKLLLPFFQLPGTIMQYATLVQVELRPFNDRALNRDLAILCERINQA